MPSLSQNAIAIALQEIGVSEIAGKNNNPRIIEYQHSVDNLDYYSDSEVPWCSCFANWCIQKAVASDGGHGKGTRNPMARSWLKWGRKVDSPKYGDIVVFWRGVDGISGHVGFVLEDHGAYLKIVSGNDGDQVKVGIYTKVRVLGYRRSLDG